jgi:hypothetical protein
MPLEYYRFRRVWKRFHRPRLERKCPKIVDIFRRLAPIPLPFRGFIRYVCALRILPLPSGLATFSPIAPRARMPENRQLSVLLRTRSPALSGDY